MKHPPTFRWKLVQVLDYERAGLLKTIDTSHHNRMAQRRAKQLTTHTHTHIYIHIPVKITVLSSLFFNMIKGPCPSTGTKYVCTFMLEGFRPPERTCSTKNTYMLLEGTRVFDVSQLHGLFRCQNQCAMELWLPIFILKRQCSPIT